MGSKIKNNPLSCECANLRPYVEALHLEEGKSQQEPGFFKMSPLDVTNLFVASGGESELAPKMHFMR